MKTKNFWIGLYRNSVNQKFTWIDGSINDYSHWYHEQPDFGDKTKNCVILSVQRFGFHNINCDKKYKAICKKHKNNWRKYSSI